MDCIDEEGNDGGEGNIGGEMDGDHDDNEAITFTNSLALSNSSSTQIKQSSTSKVRWSKLITGKVVSVVKPGNREYVAVVSEQNGSG